MRNKFVIDLFGLSEKEVRQQFPEVYQHLLCKVWDYEEKNKRTGKMEKKGRKHNRRESYKDSWWIFGEPRREFRPTLDGLKRYIGTVDTAKHRVFQFLDSNIVCDDKVVLIADDRAETLGMLSSRIHTEWALQLGGWLGMGNDSVYVKSRVFDPFPFPDATPEQRAAIAELAEELDATRKQALAEVPGLTMTELYNLRELHRSGAELSPQRQDSVREARAGIVDRLHQQLDAAVAEAYGWPADLSPAEIVTRLVALNHERAAEEAQGKIRWLRPDYQQPRFGGGAE